MAVVFVNFRNGDEPYAAALIYRTLAERFGPDTVFRSTDSLQPGTKWAEEIWVALEECDILVAVIGPRWLEMKDAAGRMRLRQRTDWVRLEIVRALKDGKHVIPVLVNGAARLDRKRLPRSLAALAARQSIVLDHRDTERGLAKLVAETQRYVPEAAEAAADSPYRTVGWLSPWNVPPRVERSVERLDILHEIAAALKESDGRACVLTGGVGVGKTHLATEFAYRYAGDYEQVWWISAEHPELMTAQLALLGGALGVDVRSEAEAVLPAIFAGLRRHGRFLLVLDGLEDPHLLRRFIALSAVGHLLVTSRRSDWGLLPTSAVAVSRFSRDESVQLLRMHIPGSPATAELAALAASVDDIALALTQAAVFVASGAVTPAEYTDLVSRRTREMLTRGETYLYPRSLNAAWTIGLEALRESAPLAMELLELLSVMAAAPLPGEALLAWKADPLAVKEAIHALGRSGLIAIEAGRVHPHGLFQAFVREPIAASRRQELAEAGRVLLAAMRRGDPRGADPEGDYAVLLPHALALDIEAGAHPQCRELLLDLAQYLTAHGDPGMALRMSTGAMRRWQAEFGPDADCTLDAAAHAAQAHYHLGNHAEAVKLDRNVHRRMLAKYGEEDPRTLTAAHNVAIASWALKPGSDPIHLAHIVIQRTRILGDDDPDTMRSTHNLGLGLRAAGDITEARRVDTANLERLRARLGADHPDTLRSAYAVGLDLMAMRQAALALDLHADTYQRRCQVLGEDHTDTLRSGYALAACHRATGSAEGLAVAAQVYQRRKEVLGEHHIDTLRSAMLYGEMAIAFGPPAEVTAARELVRETAARVAAVALPNQAR
ncbi:ATP-binding protein [Rhizocola hellebori]|uniref:ATP-binding protein n=1 Tax=Rhizocola hellebori TaxID=1392758 RepID=A0A8J3QHB1_9ACTN|nr:FxSxx-COOH system tetratricopeptide repeat protein [Rhizocola hellebori]GIH10875.1 ATP-binding protein [Rhizocola hellebori]